MQTSCSCRGEGSAGRASARLLEPLPMGRTSGLIPWLWARCPWESREGRAAVCCCGDAEDAFAFEEPSLKSQSRTDGADPSSGSHGPAATRRCTGKRLCSRLGCRGGPGSEGCAAAAVQQPAEGESERGAWLFPGFISQEHGF